MTLERMMADLRFLMEPHLPAASNRSKPESDGNIQPPSNADVLLADIRQRLRLLDRELH